jgi:hypothetical protein
MEETWRSFAAAHYRKLKAANPKATYKEALKSAAPLYQEQKNNLYKVRGQVAALHRAKPHAKHQAKADRVEAHQYGGVLRNLKFDFNYGQGFFDDDLSWGVKGGGGGGGGGGGDGEW